MTVRIVHEAAAGELQWNDGDKKMFYCSPPHLPVVVAFYDNMRGDMQTVRNIRAGALDLPIQNAFPSDPDVITKLFRNNIIIITVRIHIYIYIDNIVFNGNGNNNLPCATIS